MARSWPFSKRSTGDRVPETGDRGAPGTRYVTRAARPGALLAARIGLWVAVGFGLLGGMVGLLRPSGTDAEPAADEGVDDTAVPTPVAGIAELAVAEWLTATDENQERLDALFVEPPLLQDIDTEGLAVRRVVTIGGEQLEDGYWTITVAADVVEEDDVIRWFVEVAVVGEVSGGLAVLGTPSVMPVPPEVPEGWRRSDQESYTPDPDDPVVATVEGFLGALLTGDGDPARYLAPQVETTSLDPAPFVDVTVTEMALEDLETGEVVAWTEALVTTAAGARQVVAYELLVAERDGRWEILEFPGAPTFIERETPDTTGAPATDATDDADDTSDTSGTDGMDGTSGTGQTTAESTGDGDPG